METQTKTPNNTDQTSGGHYVTFTGLNNIKNTSGTPYAITTIVGPKLSNKNRPSTVTATNFKFNIPSDAIVKKITVHYRHGKRAVNQQLKPSTDPKLPIGNIPSPTIYDNNLDLILLFSICVFSFFSMNNYYIHRLLKKQDFINNFCG